MINEEGEYLPDLQDKLASSRKGRSGKISLPGISDDEIKLQTARTDVQNLQ